MLKVNQLIGFGAHRAAVAAAPGILDTYTNAAAAYSFRRLRAAYAGSAVRIRESGGNTEADIGFDGSGDFDAAAAATHIGGGSGFIAKWYDQSGNGDDLVQATAGDQPAYTASGIGSLPCASFNGDRLQTATDAIVLGVSGSTTLSVLCVVDIQTGSANNCRVVSMLETGQSLDYNNAGSCIPIVRTTDPTVLGFRSGTPLSFVSMSMDEDHVWLSIFDGSNHTLYGEPGTEAGSATASTGTLLNPTGTLAVGNSIGTGVEGIVGPMGEMIIWAADQTSNKTAILADVKTYWGI